MDSRLLDCVVLLADKVTNILFVGVGVLLNERLQAGLDSILDHDFGWQAEVSDLDLLGLFFLFVCVLVILEWKRDVSDLVASVALLVDKAVLSHQPTVNDVV